MYWDNESTPSVEAPIGDFFGLGLGEYFTYQSLPLAVGSIKALNSYFPMPFQKMGKITMTNEGKLPVYALYYNIDYRAYKNPLPAEYPLLSRPVSPVYSMPGLDQPMEFQWQPACGYENQPRRARAITCGWKPAAAATMWA